MRLKTILVGTSVAIFLSIGFTCESQHFNAFAQSAQTAESPSAAVGAQYDTTHVYVPVADFERFVTSVARTHSVPSIPSSPRGTTSKSWPQQVRDPSTLLIYTPAWM
jgi:hypothetical protein